MAACVFRDSQHAVEREGHCSAKHAGVGWGVPGVYEVEQDKEVMRSKRILRHMLGTCGLVPTNPPHD